MPRTDSISRRELRASIGLAGIFGLRMLGMFVILPVFALYARDLPGGANQTLVGAALGAYGLSQALLQVPFGWLSDRWGRKATIYLGLLVFALGSLIAGLAQDIYLVIAGRAIQGAGAISAAVIALTADLTTEENRTKAMAIIGMTIGATFAISMVIAPALEGAIGVPGIFLLTGVLAIMAMLVVRFVVPDPEAGPPSVQAGVPVIEVLRDRELGRLNFGIFTLHAILMALFVVVPLELEASLPGSHHWKVYLPVMLAGVALMLPAMLVSERKARRKPAFVGAIGVLAISAVVLASAQSSLPALVTGLVLFFAGFNLLEASLPSLVSKVAPAAAKGTAIGVYSTTQFIGAFSGAVAGGWIAEHFGPAAVFMACAAAAAIWLAVAAGMRAPERLSTRRYPLPRMDSARAQGLVRKLAGLPGVREALLGAEGVAYLKVDSSGFDEQNVLRILASET
jgi:MFS family permease